MAQVWNTGTVASRWVGRRRRFGCCMNDGGLQRIVVVVVVAVTGRILSFGVVVLHSLARFGG